MTSTPATQYLARASRCTCTSWRWRADSEVLQALELGTLGTKVISMADQFPVGSYGQWQLPIPSLPHQRSRTGWTGKPDPRQAMLLLEVGHGRQRFLEKGHRLPASSHKVVLPYPGTTVPGHPASSARGCPTEYLPRHPTYPTAGCPTGRSCTSSAPEEPRHAGGTTLQRPSHTCPTLCLSASDRLSYQFNHITHASTHTLSQIGLIPCCATTPSGAQSRDQRSLRAATCSTASHLHNVVIRHAPTTWPRSPAHTTCHRCCAATVQADSHCRQGAPVDVVCSPAQCNHRHTFWAIRYV